jgi:hypothetical protein
MDEDSNSDVIKECARPPFRSGGRPAHNYWVKGNVGIIIDLFIEIINIADFLLPLVCLS